MNIHEFRNTFDSRFILNSNSTHVQRVGNALKTRIRMTNYAGGSVARLLYTINPLYTGDS